MNISFILLVWYTSLILWQRPSLSESEVAVRDLIVPTVILNIFAVDMYGSFAVLEAEYAQNPIWTRNLTIFAVIHSAKIMKISEGFF